VNTSRITSRSRRCYTAATTRYGSTTASLTGATGGRGLAAEVTPHAEDAEYHEVFEDTVGHGRPDVVDL